MRVIGPVGLCVPLAMASVTTLRVHEAHQRLGHDVGSAAQRVERAGAAEGGGGARVATVASATPTARRTGRVHRAGCELGGAQRGRPATLGRPAGVGGSGSGRSCRCPMKSIAIATPQRAGSGVWPALRTTAKIGWANCAAAARPCSTGVLVSRSPDWTSTATSGIAWPAQR